GVQCLPEETVENRAGRTDLVRRAYLTKDLALAGHHRVEARCDTEEVESRRLVLEPVERSPEVRFEREQRRLGAPLGIRSRFVCEIQLRPVAGGETHGLAGVAAEPARELGCLMRRQRSTLAKLDGCAVMRDADEDDPHEKCVTGRASRTTAT